MSVNHLRITGFIQYDPKFEESGRRRIKLKLQSHDEESGRYTLLKCLWEDPPDKYWKLDRIKKGTLILVEGKVYSSAFDQEEDFEKGTPYLYITHFHIYSTKEEHEIRKKNAVDKGRTYKL